MSDDDMHGLDHLDAATEARLARDAVGRYVAESVKAARPSKAVHKKSVDAVEVVVKLTQPGPLTAGMKVDVYFGPERAAQERTAKESKN